MIKKLWQWVKGSEDSILGDQEQEIPEDYPNSSRDKKTPSNSYVKEENLEYLFSQLLEGVSKGWTENRIEQFFQALEPKITIEIWLKWLHKYRHKLLNSHAPNYHLASRMIILGELTATLPFLRPVGDLAYEVGQEILHRTDGDLEIESLSPDSEKDAQGNSPQPLTSLADILELLQKNTQFAEEMAQKLGLKTTDPGIIMEKLITASQSVSEFSLGEFSDSMNNIPSEKQESTVDLDWLTRWFNLGLEKAKNGDLEGAIASWEKILQVDSNLPQVWNNKGSALAYLERYQEALECFDNALVINVNDVESWNNRGNALYNLYRWEEALISWERVIGIHPNYVQAWYNKGRVLEKLGRTQEALNCYTKVSAIDPDFPRIQDHLKKIQLGQSLENDQ